MLHNQFKMIGRQYSSSGGKYNPVLLWKHRLPFGQYSFLAIDATPIPGPRRPYNFFGVLDKVSFDLLKEREDYNYNYRTN